MEDKLPPVVVSYRPRTEGGTFYPPQYDDQKQVSLLLAEGKNNVEKGGESLVLM